MMRKPTSALLVLAALAALPAPSSTQSPSVLPAQLAARAATGPVRVIVRLQSVAADSAAIARAQDDTLQALPNAGHAVTRFSTIAGFAVTTDLDGLSRLAALPSVAAIEEDVVMYQALMDSAGVIKANALWDNGVEGSGWSVAILDTGVDKNHTLFAGKVTSEACFSTDDPASSIISLCPGRASSSTAPGSGLNCTGYSGCDHGTHVAGIAAASTINTTVAFSGVARGANIIAVQVFSVQNGATFAFSSDIIRGLERVLQIAGSNNAGRIAAVNMSIAGQAHFSSPCDAGFSTLTTAVENLRAIGIPTIVSAGNDGYLSELSFPSCLSRTISVGSTTKSDTMSSFSNRSSRLKLVAPGSAIFATLPANAFGVRNGTSMAAPHVAGAWALMKSLSPDISVDVALQALQRSATPIADNSSGLTFSRIAVDRAAGSMGPDGSPTAVTVTRTGSNVHVSWDPPFDGTTPSSYRVEFTLQSTGQTAAIVDVGAGRSLTTTLPNASYRVRVRSGSTGAASTDMPFTVGAVGNTQAPLAPQNLRAELDGQTVRLSWNMPLDSNAATSFVLDVGTAPGLTNLASSDIGSSAMTWVGSVAIPGTYYVRVRARNAFGTSAGASNEVAVIVTGGGGCQAPFAPAGLSGTVAAGLITLNWNQPALSGTITGYIVEVGSAPGLSNILSLPTGPSTIIAGAAPSGTYYVRVRALTACGQSVPSNEVIVVVP